MFSDIAEEEYDFFQLLELLPLSQMDKQKQLLPGCSLRVWRVGSWYIRSCTAAFSIATQEQGIKHGMKHFLFVVLEGWEFVLSLVSLFTHFLLCPVANKA